MERKEGWIREGIEGRSEKSSGLVFLIFGGGCLMTLKVGSGWHSAGAWLLAGGGGGVGRQAKVGLASGIGPSIDNRPVYKKNP